MASASPLFLKTNADGSVSLDFTGHISAEGLDLQAAQAATPPVARQMVRWLRQADGAAVAYITSQEGITGRSLTLEVDDDLQQSSRSIVQMTARSGPGANVAQLQCNARSIGVTKSDVIMSADGSVIRLLNGDGQSEFTQSYTGGLLKRVVDRYYIVDSGLLAPGTGISVNVNHNLNRVGNWQFMTANIDGGFGYWIQDTIGVVDANNIYVAFYNLGPGNALTQTWLTIRTFD
jgi:hypothetical protein